jgi:hypothetical protein
MLLKLKRWMTLAIDITAATNAAVNVSGGAA